MKRLEAALAPGRGRAVRGGRLRRAPVPGQGLHRAGRAGRERRALPRRPPDRHRHGVGDGRGQGGPPRRRPRRRAATSPRTARSRPPRCARATRRPTAPGCSRPPAASRSGTSSSSAASTPTPSASTRSGPDSKPDPDHHGLLRRSASRAWSRRSPSRATTSTAWSGRARWRRSTCTWSPRASRPRSGRAPRRSPPSSTPRGCGCCSTTATASPGVKFADAELVGVPTIVVVGRGLASGVIEVKDRKTGERTEVALASAVEHLVELTGQALTRARRSGRDPTGARSGQPVRSSALASTVSSVDRLGVAGSAGPPSVSPATSRRAAPPLTGAASASTVPPVAAQPSRPRGSPDRGLGDGAVDGAVRPARPARAAAVRPRPSGGVPSGARVRRRRRTTGRRARRGRPGPADASTGSSAAAANPRTYCSPPQS